MVFSLMMAFSLPELPYSFDALEPYIDAKTMEVHYTKHHQAYLDKFNKAIEGTDMATKPLEYIIRNISKTNDTVRNNAGGYYNHNLFWLILSPKGGGEPTGPVGEAIRKRYQDFNTFKSEFTQAALNRFGSGWVWLCKNSANELFICSTPNQDNPLMDVVDEQCKGIPILGLDVWEHAYYLKYQNRRAEYIEAFWNVVNWEEVNKRFQ
jgi:superoxide dismutase, Fe-Mn family